MLQDVTATLATDYGYLFTLRLSCLEVAVSAFGPVDWSDEFSGPGVWVCKDPRYFGIYRPRLIKGNWPGEFRYLGDYTELFHQ